MRPQTPPFIIHDLQDSQMFALAQAAGRAGFTVHGLASWQAPWIELSRYVSSCTQVQSLGDVVESVYALHVKQAGLQGVWLPCVDDIAMFTAEFRPFLQDLGMLALIPSMDSIERADVTQLQDFSGILKIPETYWLEAEAMAERADVLPYPCLLKSARGFFRILPHKESLLQALDEQRDDALLQRVQHYIAGDTSRMATAMLLFDAHGKVVRGFTGRRLRVARTQFGAFGETTAAQAEWIPELYDGAVALLEHIGWQGFAEVECKQGEDGQWYVLEINPRVSGWLCLAEADGAGFLQAYHALCTGSEVLQSCCLQTSRYEYIRMLSAGFHEPDWVGRSDMSQGRWARLRCLAGDLYQMWKHSPFVVAGAWDAWDRQASWCIIKQNLRQYLGWR